MSLADRLSQPPPATKGPKCTACALLHDLPADEADALRAALDNPLWRGTDLARTLTAAGHAMKPNTVQRHRRGDCQGTDR